MDQTTDGMTEAGPDAVAVGGTDAVTDPSPDPVTDTALPADMDQGLVEDGPAAEAPAEAEPAALPTPPALPPAPDRADAPVSEVAERFLRAILQRLPLACIEEVHLFSPLRQGTVETGIAVVAARPADVVPLEPPLALESPEPVALAEPAEPTAPPSVRRHEVHTARYRLVIKGPERGRWEEDLVAEADAPLITVETVVRGVQRRAGEATETIRYSAAQVARALRLPYPAA
jgi:hypothetical protein